MTKITSKEQLLETFKEQFSTRPAQAIKALLFVYDRQTEDEKSQKETMHDNGMGFQARHAKILSSLAEQYRNKGYLSEKQLKLLMKIIPTYANQIMNHSIATGKIRKEGKFYVW